MRASVLIILTAVSAVLATNARVESMGKTATFFMDDMSIYENPANVSIYPNFLIGEAGHMTIFKDTSALSENQDPSEPYGGGILSLSLSKDKDGESRYPMLSVGVMLNHRNEMIDVLLDAAEANGHKIPTPVVPNSDFFIGYALPNGTMIGGHFYAARQNITVPQDSILVNKSTLTETGLDFTDSEFSAIKAAGSASLNWISNAIRGDIGVNMPIGQNKDLEVALGVGLLNYHGPSVSAIGPLGIEAYDDLDFSMFFSARLFSTMVSLNGEIVPVVKYKSISVRKYEKSEFDVGVGANITLDRGFFWFGAEVISSTTKKRGGSEKNQIDIPLGFGIERNVVWDWLVLRVGLRKTIWGTEENSGGLTMNFSNPEADMTSRDHVGGGIGINIEERLKIDAVMAEDILYKWGNLISGNSHHIFTRITATYSF
ncbi:MAG: hypothetical protein JNL74_20490 [Fibrobacteres bacterium]|nr:hypothetical protein [Fibrobacterota bacterium]